MASFERDILVQAPTAQGIAAAISEAVQSGRLARGERLPSIREVARLYRVSPTTVASAWSLLVQSGTIDTAGRRGTTVAAPPRAGRHYRRAWDHRDRFPLDLSFAGPDPALVPDLRAALRSMEANFAVTPSPQDELVLPELEAILRERCTYQPEAMTIVDGAIDGLDVVTRAAIPQCSRVVVENPCFPPLLDLLEASQATVVGVDLDEEGMNIAAIERAFEEPVAGIYLQPLGQNPTGVSMSEARAAEIAAIVGRTDALVVEDAACSAIARGGDSLSLGKWLPDQTVHIYSFSKSHGPELRIASVSGPRRVIDGVIALRRRAQGWTSRILQELLLTMLRDQESERRVERAIQQYTLRRGAMVDYLASEGITVLGTEGYNLWLPVVDETAAVLGAFRQGVGVAPGSAFMVSPGSPPHLRVTTSCLYGEEIPRVGGILAQIARSSSWLRT